MKKFLVDFFCCKKHRSAEMKPVVKRDSRSAGAEYGERVGLELDFSPRTDAPVTASRPISLPNRKRSLWVDVSESPRSAPSAYSTGFHVFIEYPKDAVNDIYLNYEKVTP
jgi:hypothetical protein